MVKRPASRFVESRVLARRGMPGRVHRHDRLAVVRRRTLRRVAGGVDLAAVYNWFTERFDTVDLQEAKVLVQSVS